jgi:hypothetical protein
MSARFRRASESSTGRQSFLRTPIAQSQAPRASSAGTADSLSRGWSVQWREMMPNMLRWVSIAQMNRWSRSLLRVVLALVVISLAGIASAVVGALFHSHGGPVPGLAFVATAVCLLIFIQRTFPSVYPRHYRPRPWWQTRAAEGPFIIAFGILVSILSSRIATLWFGMLTVSGLLVALLLRVTNRGGESQDLFAHAGAEFENHLQLADHPGSRSAFESPELHKRINQSARPARRLWGKPPFSIPDNYAIDVRNV